MGRELKPPGRAVPGESAAVKLPPPWLRLVLSLAVVIQLSAVIAEPFQFFTRSLRGVSPAAEPLRSVLSPYIEFAYLNHGYFFFAPEPGPSHLIDCQMTLEDGKQAHLRFPDRGAQWPRLLYHRHFMLAENLHQLWAPPLDETLLAADDPLRPLLLADRQRFEAVRDSMRRHIKQRYGAQAVTLERVEHRLPSSDEVFRDRMRLDDPNLYVTLPDTPLDGTDELLPPAVPPAGLAPPLRLPGELDRTGPATVTPEQIEVLP
jgi:hypothetical protein